MNEDKTNNQQEEKMDIDKENPKNIDNATNKNTKLINTKNNAIVVKSDKNTSIVRSDLYNTDLQEYGVYKNFNYVDISSIENLNKKFVVYNLPDVNDDEIKEFFITLLNKLTPNINNSKSLNPIISFDKRDNGEYYIIEVEKHEQVYIMRNLDGIEWLGYRLKIESPKDFFKDYNDTKGKIAIREKINQSKLLEGALNNNDNSTNNNRLILTGLPDNIEENEVRKIIESFGQIKYFNLVSKKNNRDITNTFCFFEYESPQNIYKALKGLNNLSLGDKQLKVQKMNNSKNNNTSNKNNDNENNIGVYNTIVENATIATKILQDAKEGKIDNNTNNFQNELNINSVAEKKVFTDLNNISYDILYVPEYAVTPSRVIMFINAVSPEDLIDDEDYEDILNDFRQKCSLYGTVLNIEIPRPDKITQTYTEEVGKIFIKFSNLKSAKIAKYNLSGLKYNRRIIVGSFYPESYFDVREFNYQEQKIDQTQRK